MHHHSFDYLSQHSTQHGTGRPSEAPEASGAARSTRGDAGAAVCRYAVLPMAVARDTVVAICLAGTTIDVSNNDDALYPAYSFVPDPSQLLDTENHVWANYALAAYKGVHDFLAVNPAAETELSRSYPGIKARPCCVLRAMVCCARDAVRGGELSMVRADACGHTALSAVMGCLSDSILLSQQLAA